jgi:hypothetical protein
MSSSLSMLAGDGSGAVYVLIDTDSRESAKHLADYMLDRSAALLE